MVTPTTAHELIRDTEWVRRAREEQAIEESPGVRRTLLWQQDGSAAGVLELEPGARIGEHRHAVHAHHVWVVEGRAEVLGRELGPEAYWFVPPDVPHTLTAIGDGPCRLFYLYLRV